MMILKLVLLFFIINITSSEILSTHDKIIITNIFEDLNINEEVTCDNENILCSGNKVYKLTLRNGDGDITDKICSLYYLSILEIHNTHIRDIMTDRCGSHLHSIYMYNTTIYNEPSHFLSTSWLKSVGLFDSTVKTLDIHNILSNLNLISLSLVETKIEHVTRGFPLYSHQKLEMLSLVNNGLEIDLTTTDILNSPNLKVIILENNKIYGKIPPINNELLSFTVRNTCIKEITLTSKSPVHCVIGNSVETYGKTSTCDFVTEDYSCDDKEIPVLYKEDIIEIDKDLINTNNLVISPNTKLIYTYYETRNNSIIKAPTITIINSTIEINFENEKILEKYINDNMTLDIKIMDGIIEGAFNNIDVLLSEEKFNCLNIKTNEITDFSLVINPRGNCTKKTNLVLILSVSIVSSVVIILLVMSILIKPIREFIFPFSKRKSIEN